MKPGTVIKMKTIAIYKLLIITNSSKEVASNKLTNICVYTSHSY
jgi:hypothetical protein